MDMVMANGFVELTAGESNEIDGGKFSDVFEKIELIPVVGWIYQLGQDFGQTSVKFGREIYRQYEDMKKIFS